MLSPDRHDHHSRYLLCCDGLEGPRLAETQTVFSRLFQMSRRIRTDNGVPFATTAAGLSRLAIRWISLGISPERIEPGKPQQNGRHERMHRTLKQAATQPPERSLAFQQRRFDQFLKSYNQVRPHEALLQKNTRIRLSTLNSNLFRSTGCFGLSGLFHRPSRDENRGD